MNLLPGTEVIARGLRWEVIESQPMGNQTRIRLRGLSGVFAGRKFDLLSPFEQVQSVSKELNPEKAAPLPNWLVYHQAFLLEQALGSGAFLAVQPGRLRIEPYQLVPLVRALGMSRPRLLLADDVGLGKTIEAGLITAELMARRQVHRLLVVTPAGLLLEQWKEEMLERFGLRLLEADRLQLELIRRSTELGSNPFHHLPLAIASMDFLKQDHILDLLERTTYDLVIIDEAHHYSETGDDQAQSDRIEASQRRKLAATLSRRSDALLLLTATPHDGYERSFTSLVELLDPSLLDGKGRVDQRIHLTHVVRRLKKHVKVTHPETGELVSFPVRKVIPVPVVPEQGSDHAFINLHAALLQFIVPELKRVLKTRQFDDALAYLALLKRSTSTVCALASTLKAVRERFEALSSEKAEELENRSQRRKSLKAFQRKLARFGTLTTNEEAERERLEVEELAQQLKFLDQEARRGEKLVTQSESIIASLARIESIAEVSSDLKLEELIAAIRSIRAEEPSANILIYTEYVDSLKAAKDTIDAANLGPVLTIQGTDDPDVRKSATQIFRSREGYVLVSTDASAEGLNLHERCHHLIHLELPWNPNRLEQRNGRIDRYGQWQTPTVRYLYLCDTFEEKILARLVAKYERQRDKLRFMPNTLGIDLSDLPQEGLFTALTTERAKGHHNPCKSIQAIWESDSEPEESFASEIGELLAEVEKSLRRFEHAARTHTWLGEEGAAADEAAQRRATNALEVGKQAADIDLVRFVKQAVLSENGQVREQGKIISLQLPKTWQFGMEDIPGWDASSGLLRVTTDLRCMVDDRGKPVGYLGRAHPVVRRAIEQVRFQALGQAVGLDRRVSAARSPDGKLSLLVTFLGREDSTLGREYERVLAVKVSETLVASILEKPQEWLPGIDAALPTKDAWNKWFADWGNAAITSATEKATTQFNEFFADFEAAHQRQCEDEMRLLDNWFESCIDRLTQVSEIRTLPLFEGLAEVINPLERLETWKKNSSHPYRDLLEADALHELYLKRKQTLEGRRQLTRLTPRLIGALMLIP